MSKRDSKLLLADILDTVEKIKKYTTGLTFDTFITDDKTLNAVIRNFEIIGEAATDFLTILRKHMKWWTGFELLALETVLFMTTWELIIELFGQLLKRILINYRMPSVVFPKACSLATTTNSV